MKGHESQTVDATHFISPLTRRRKFEKLVLLGGMSNPIFWPTGGAGEQPAVWLISNCFSSEYFFYGHRYYL